MCLPLVGAPEEEERKINFPFFCTFPFSQLRFCVYVCVYWFGWIFHYRNFCGKKRFSILFSSVFTSLSQCHFARLRARLCWRKSALPKESYDDFFPILFRNLLGARPTTLPELFSLLRLVENGPQQSQAQLFWLINRRVTALSPEDNSHDKQRAKKSFPEDSHAFRCPPHIHSIMQKDSPRN